MKSKRTGVSTGSSTLVATGTPSSIRTSCCQDNDLPSGLYERLITASLKARLLQFDPAATRISTQGLDAAEAHATLARHVEDVVARALRGIPQEDRLAKQAEVANEIIRRLGFNG